MVGPSNPKPPTTLNMKTASMLQFMQVHEEAAYPAAAAFWKSMWYTLSTNGSAFLLLMWSQHALDTPSAALAWAGANWWPFVLAQVVAPVLRTRAAVNLYTPK